LLVWDAGRAANSAEKVGHESGQQRRAFGHCGHHDVLVVGVGSATDRAEPVQRRRTDPPP